MAMTINASISVDTQGNQQLMKNYIKQEVHMENYIKPQMIDYFTVESEKIVRSVHDFQNLKTKIQKIAQELETTRSVRKYYEAYEAVLDTRVFFMGGLADISYILTIAINEEPVDVPLSRKQLDDILFHGKKFGLSNTGSSLRFNRAALDALESYALEVLINNDEFQIVSKDRGMDLHFQNPRWMRKELDRLQALNEHFYSFVMEKQVDIRNKMHFQITAASGGKETDTVFSAVGQYAVDELYAKEQAAAQEQALYKGQMNIGNLTEIYIKYKALVNQGHNHFPERRYVSGEELFPIFREVRGNTDPWYSGGDFLEAQIKSFLGSMPTLASLKTVKTMINDLNRILSSNNLEEIKKELSQMFIQNTDKINNNLDKQAARLATLLSESLASMVIQK